MKKKLLIVLGIILIILFAFGVFTSYQDSTRVRNNMEPIYVIKTISYHGDKVIYWGLGYKIIRYVGVSPNEQFKSNEGVKFGSWFMNYEIEKNQSKINEKTEYEKKIDNTTIKLDIPKEWKYEELTKDTENDIYKYALKIYKNHQDKYAVLYYYNQIFGVCGTERTSKQINLNNGKKATIGYYNGENVWQDISFYETNKYIAIINYGLNKEESEEFINFVKTININDIDL